MGNLFLLCFYESWVEHSLSKIKIKKRKKKKDLKEGAVICQCEKEWGQESLAATIMGVVLVVGTQWVRGPAVHSFTIYCLITLLFLLYFSRDAAALSTSNFQFQAREFHFFPALFSKDEWIFTHSLVHESQKIDFGRS